MDGSENEGSDNASAMISMSSSVGDQGNDSVTRQSLTSARGSAYSSVSPSAASAQGGSHQSLLRQQAHAPVGLGSARFSPSAAGLGSFSISSPNAYSHPRLEDLGGGANEPQQLASSIPEHGVSDPSRQDASATSSGWSIVETNGGIPPSARSLHAAALLNGVMYVFGGK